MKVCPSCGTIQGTPHDIGCTFPKNPRETPRQRRARLSIGKPYPPGSPSKEARRATHLAASGVGFFIGLFAAYLLVAIIGWL